MARLSIYDRGYWVCILYRIDEYGSSDTNKVDAGNKKVT
jgi:hypothetical protein